MVEGETGWRFIYGYDAVCRRVFTLTNFFCTGYRSKSWHLAMASANIACISWDYTFLQTDIAICLVIVVCFRIFLSVFTVRTLKNRIREAFSFVFNDSTGERCGGLPTGSSHPAGFILSKKSLSCRSRKML